MSWLFLGWLLRRLRRMAQLRSSVPKGIFVPGALRGDVVPCATIALIGRWVDRAGAILRQGNMSIGICHDHVQERLHDTDGRELLAVLMFTDEGMQSLFAPKDILQALGIGSMSGARAMMFIFVPQAVLADRSASVRDNMTFIDASFVTLDGVGADALELAVA